MNVTLTKVREAKNGIVSYKPNRLRAQGTVYFDKKCFPNGAPESLTIDAEGYHVAEAPVRATKAKTEAAPAQEPEAVHA